jgi:hypothetical protein
MQGMGDFLGADLQFAAAHPDRVASGPAREIRSNPLMTDIGLRRWRRA